MNQLYIGFLEKKKEKEKEKEKLSCVAFQKVSAYFHLVVIGNQNPVLAQAVGGRWRCCCASAYLLICFHSTLSIDWLT